MLIKSLTKSSSVHDFTVCSDDNEVVMASKSGNAFSVIYRPPSPRRNAFFRFS